MIGRRMANIIKRFTCNGDDVLLANFELVSGLDAEWKPLRRPAKHCLPKPNELDRFHEARKVCSECLLRVLFNGTKIRRFLRLSIGLWSHMRTLITQPNSNLRKTFNSFPKQNSDENVQRNGDMRFLFDKSGPFSVRLLLQLSAGNPSHQLQ